MTRLSAIVCLALWLTAALLASCTGRMPSPPDHPANEPQPRAEPRSASGNRSPYRVHGRTYEVLPSSAGYIATGIASWYGPKFHGRPTSSGEIFDMYQFTAAHKSLPLPTYAQVTHLGNGRSVLVRINDRGPFKDDRVIDLSFAAARKLDMIEAGTARVEIVALDPGGAEPRPVITQTSGIYLQLGAFGNRDNALALVQRLRNQGISDVQIATGLSDAARTVHRVRVGPFVNAELAEELAARIVLMGFEHPRVIFD